MRILHISSAKVYGGIDTALLSLATYRRACPALYQHFGYCFQGRFENELKGTGALSFYLGPVRSSQLWTVAAARKRFRELLAKYNYDAVVCHSPWAMVVFGSIVRTAKARLIYWVHNVPFRQAPILSFEWTCEKWAKLIRPDLVICNSQFSHSFADEIYPGVSSQVIYCPVRLDGFGLEHRDEVRHWLGADERTSVIIQVCRPQPWKGQSLHIEALAKLKNLRGWQCWMVGGAQEKSESKHLFNLEKLANEMGIGERVKFLGQREDVQQLLLAADIFCHPNITPEPFGIVYIEALHAGLPIIATDQGGAKEIVTPHCGLLVPPGDVDALAGALKTLIENVPYRKELGQQGAARAKELCESERRIDDLYQLLRTTCVSG